MSARVRFKAALLVIATCGAFAAAPASASAPPSSTPPSNVALYPLDEFIGRWNDANDLVDGFGTNAPWVAISAAAPAAEDRAISEAAALSTQIASTAVPPAPAPAAGGSGSSVPPDGLASPTAEAATTTLPPSTTVLPSVTSVFPSIDAFAAAWNETTVQMALVDPTVEVFHFDSAAVVRGPLPPDTNLGDVESFAVPIATNGFVGGLVDTVTGAVMAVTVGGDPDAQIVRGAAGVLLLSTLDASVARPAVEAWAALAADTSEVKLDYVVAGPLGVMHQVVEGAEAGDNLVSIVIAPATTEEEAFVDSYLTYVAVFGLALKAPPPPTTTPAAPLSATTAPIAPLPSVPPSTVTTTTVLPLVSLAPPTPTTLVAPSGNQSARE